MDLGVFGTDQVVQFLFLVLEDCDVALFVMGLPQKCL